MNATTNGSMDEAEIQVLLDGWIQARRKVWDALFELATANAPAPWLEFLERTDSYGQMVDSLLQAQAAGVSTALRCFGAINAMQQHVTTSGEGIQRLAATAADAQRKSGEEGARAAAKEAPASSKAARRSAAA